MMTQNESLLLKQAFDTRDRLYFATLPAGEQLRAIPVSEKFERRMKRLLRRADKIYYPIVNTLAKRVACVVLSLLTLLSATTLSVKALREPFFQFVAETYEAFTELLFPHNSTASAFLPLAPAYIPEGYSELSRTTDHVSNTITYRSSDGKVFDYMQMIDDGGLSTSVDTENALTEKIMLSDTVEALLVEKNGYRQLIFRYSGSVFQFVGQIPKEELLRCARSLIH